MAKWKPYILKEIVEKIKDKELVLPVIQRPLVWNEEKMELLFDTLMRGNSFGGVIAIKEDSGSKPLFPFREFSQNGENTKSRECNELSRSSFFIIDGQQRLQSFYIGLKGSYNGNTLFYDLFSDNKDEHLFRFAKNESDLPKESKEYANRRIKRHLWISIPYLYDRVDLYSGNNIRNIAKEFIKDKSISDETEKETIENNIDTFVYNVFTNEGIGMATVSLDKATFTEAENRQKIVELFRRLNDGGTKLSAFDLVASILKGFDWRMEGFLSEILELYDNIGLTQDNLIKLIFILQDNSTKEMSSIEVSDTTFAISNGDRIKASISALVSFLKESKLYNYYKNGNRSFIPLFFIIYHIFHKDIPTNQLETYFSNADSSNSDFKNIKKWIYNSLLNGVFKSKGAGWIPYKTGVRKILERIKDYKNKPFPDEELFNVYYDNNIVFTQKYTQDNLDELESSFLYYLMYDMEEVIRINDIDHIMPKSILETLNFDREKINSIKNFQLIDYSTNRGEKNAKPFKQWINNPIYVTDKKFFVKKHLIPDDETIWDETNFLAFIERRGELIFKKLTNYMP